jgi:hypothetical protein
MTQSLLLRLNTSGEYISSAWQKFEIPSCVCTTAWNVLPAAQPVNNTSDGKQQTVWGLS